MDITFLGTASAQPSPTRNHSSLALRLDGEVLLVDCGEATQHQLIHLNGDPSLAVFGDPRTNKDSFSSPRIAKISRILLTHLHGDHCFGLPGLLCTAGAVVRLDQADQPPPAPIHVYGPKGTKAYVRNVLLHSMSRIGRGLVLHELLLPTDGETSNATIEPHIDESPGTDFHAINIDLNASNECETGWYWTIVEGTDSADSKSGAAKLTIHAAPIKHTVPTVGYLFTEPPIPGKLRADLATPILLKNKAALGLKNPMILLAKLKNGESLTMPDGQVLSPQEFVEPSKRGRRVLILGDTSDACGSTLVQLTDRLAHSDTEHGMNTDFNIDLVIHEATNSCLQSDVEAGATIETVQQQTIDHGHSTPQMAAQFAKRVNAHRLVLNHFSSRYKGDASEESLGVMEEVRQLAVGSFSSDRVVCARDFMSVKV
ncbi:hypothetical protein HDU98_000010 [Podochytrium sp. JEL0797]|nr:hypothetical protein HDU98_000010 [Podochytrium sp. JEL0797]